NSDEDEDENKSYRLELVLPGENLNHQLKITLKYNDNIKIIKKSATMFSDFIEIPYQEVSNE
ncbi:MAG: hypothetical protein F6K24_26085, partial [Okeania sp. SIO2D1]|nr:hypothetical protein [Okeania sp. SIO2D1]